MSKKIKKGFKIKNILQVYINNKKDIHISFFIKTQNLYKLILLVVENKMWKLWNVKNLCG